VFAGYRFVLILADNLKSIFVGGQNSQGQLGNMIYNYYKIKKETKNS